MAKKLLRFKSKPPLLNLWLVSHNLKVKYSPVSECNSHLSIKCTGSYIKSRDGQEECLHCIIKRNENSNTRTNK